MNSSLTTFVDSMILSVSGWRALFGGAPQSLAEEVPSEGLIVARLAARLYAESLATTTRRPAIALGRDTRPTGAALLVAACAGLTDGGAEVRLLDIVAGPELMAWVASDAALDGFFYISASHNPPGFNGFKLGSREGGVLPGDAATALIARFRVAIADGDTPRDGGDASALPVHDRARWRQQAAVAYRTLLLRLGAGTQEGDARSAALRERLADRPIGVVAELNGSARTLSIDRALLDELGVASAFYNDTPGHFAHQILPEDKGLADAARILNDHYHIDETFALAYVPDNDGDRGNLVFAAEGAPRVLSAQEVFALAATIELAAAARYRPDGQVHLVVNGPTSGRIDAIAARFGATVHRVEVGEANVVERATALLRDGAFVAVAGEGSNGGIIMPPHRVRDPLATVLAMVRCHADALWSEWNERTGSDARSLVELVDALPAWCSLATDDARARLPVPELPHSTIKARWEAAIVPALASLEREISAAWGALTYRFANYEGTRVRHGAGNRTGDERGGLALIGRSAAGSDVLRLWMRGSGTEPLFRILVDCEGAGAAIFDRLVDLHRRTTVEAATAPN